MTAKVLKNFAASRRKLLKKCLKMMVGSKSAEKCLKEDYEQLLLNVGYQDLSIPVMVARHGEASDSATTLPSH